MDIKAGEQIGIIGRSGSGKTTLIKLLVGLWKPGSGIVRLDQADVYRWNRKDLGPHIGYLPQDIELFPGTVKQNIARMSEDIDSEEIVTAAQVSGAHEVILHLPKGYETEVGVVGSSLSAGQRQRIGLARAFYGQPKIIVLDEPNAHLDQEGDAALTKALFYAREQRMTTLIVAHRPSILAHVDRILVLDEGQVRLFDERDVVMQKVTSEKWIMSAFPLNQKSSYSTQEIEDYPQRFERSKKLFQWLRNLDLNYFQWGLMVISIFFVFFFLLWAFFAPLDSAAVTQGQVVLSQHQKVIQHLEGGIISDILVKEGDKVQSGQILIQLDGTEAQANLDLLVHQLRATKSLELRLLA